MLMYVETGLACCDHSSCPYRPLRDPFLTWFQCRRWGTKPQSSLCTNIHSKHYLKLIWDLIWAVWINQINWVSFLSFQYETPLFVLLFHHCSSTQKHQKGCNSSIKLTSDKLWHMFLHGKGRGICPPWLPLKVKKEYFNSQYEQEKLL